MWHFLIFHMCRSCLLYSQATQSYGADSPPRAALWGRLSSSNRARTWGRAVLTAIVVYSLPHSVVPCSITAERRSSQHVVRLRVRLLPLLTLRRLRLYDKSLLHILENRDAGRRPKEKGRRKRKSGESHE